MCTHATIQDIRRLPAISVAALPARELARLVRNVTTMRRLIAEVDEHLQAALAIRYGRKAGALRGAATNPVHLIDGDHVVISEQVTTVTWDQAKLAEAVATLRDDWHKDPARYVRAIYVVDDYAFARWPEAIRELFAPARTVTRPKPTFRFEPRPARAA
ncbi:MAG: hypothetical protein HQL34_08970 [Alphaproteobacteria bacterium]|nr:hypothetical protein [Alphaproteobacteria bacterium]